MMQRIKEGFERQTEKYRENFEKYGYSEKSMFMPSDSSLTSCDVCGELLPAIGLGVAPMVLATLTGSVDTTVLNRGSIGCWASCVERCSSRVPVMSLRYRGAMSERKRE